MGAGLSGIEAATEMTGKLRALLGGASSTQPFRVILADHESRVGSDTAIEPCGVTLRSGEEILAATVVWCAGMRANPQLIARTQRGVTKHEREHRLY